MSKNIEVERVEDFISKMGGVSIDIKLIIGRLSLEKRAREKAESILRRVEIYFFQEDNTEENKTRKESLIEEIKQFLYS